ncbi:uncharacterized protein LOC111637578 [Centruroides sculpturatus]|uniref:uncharacterized protein LOC111637578 n=1 Tax=Centruroides sculpturatus TaxID=218467 RepID=UPI000C6D93C6|nr:uncharacterized protein LOC111637578 [Centruroides sculpturatus]
MPVLGRCWSPFTLYSWSSVKLGSYYAAIYTAIIHVLFITYAIYVMGGGDSDEFYSPYFELDYKASKLPPFNENRCMFFPWMVGITIEILLVLAFSLWVLATYYRNVLLKEAPAGYTIGDITYEKRASYIMQKASNYDLMSDQQSHKVC